MAWRSRWKRPISCGSDDRVMDSIVRLSQTGDWGIDLKQQVQDK